MTNTFFNSKEDYLLFRSNFAAAVNHKNAKSKLTPCDEWIRETDTFSEGTGQHRENGWVTGAHFVFLNIVRGREMHKGFTPITNKTKLQNSGTIWNGLDIAINNLHYVVSTAHKLNSGHSVSDWERKDLDEFLEPLLGGEDKNSEIYDMYLAILRKLVTTTAKHEKYHTDFGIGLKVAKEMVKNSYKPTNYDEFMKIVKGIQ